MVGEFGAEDVRDQARLGLLQHLPVVAGHGFDPEVTLGAPLPEVPDVRVTGRVGAVADGLGQHEPGRRGVWQMVARGGAVVVVDAVVPLDLGVVDSGVHAVEPHEFVAELGHVDGLDGGAFGGVVGGLGVEEDDADVGAAGAGRQTAHLVGDEASVGEAGEDEGSVVVRGEEGEVRLGHGLDARQQVLAGVHAR